MCNHQAIATSCDERATLHVLLVPLPSCRLPALLGQMAAWLAQLLSPFF